MLLTPLQSPVSLVLSLPPSLQAAYSCCLADHNVRSVFSSLLAFLAVVGMSSKPPQLRLDFCRQAGHAAFPLGNVHISSAQRACPLG